METSETLEEQYKLEAYKALVKAVKIVDISLSQSKDNYRLHESGQLQLALKLLAIMERAPYSD